MESSRFDIGERAIESYFDNGKSNPMAAWWQCQCSIQSNFVVNYIIISSLFWRIHSMRVNEPQHQHHQIQLTRLDVSQRVRNFIKNPTKDLCSGKICSLVVRCFLSRALSLSNGLWYFKIIIIVTITAKPMIIRFHCYFGHGTLASWPCALHFHIVNITIKIIQ